MIHDGETFVMNGVEIFIMNDEGSGMPDLLPLLGQNGESIHNWLKCA